MTTVAADHRGRVKPSLRSRCGCAVAIMALTACGSAQPTAVAAPRVSSKPLSGHVPRCAASPRGRFLSVAGAYYRIVVEPALTAGDPGWTSTISYTLHGRFVGGEGGGGGYPTASWPFFGATRGFTVYPRGRAPSGDVVYYALTGPDVAAVRIGKRTIRTRSDPRLPAGDRVAVLFRLAASPPVIVPAPGPPWPRNAIRLVPLDVAGRVIPTTLPSFWASPTRFWQAPSAVGPNNHQPRYHGPTHPLPGACELTQHGLPGLTPEFGHVISHITPVSTSEGEVFLSCIETEYYLHSWPLEVALLLDAAQPGQTLGPIPGGLPVPGHPDTVNLVAGQFQGPLTARRIGAAWLVVQGGANVTQRLQALKALQIHKLDLKP
jgi:hypothetical protein